MDQDRVAARPEDWASIVETLRGTVSRQQFETWFRTMRPVSLEPGRYVFCVPNAFLRDWIQGYYADLLRNCVASALGNGAASGRGGGFVCLNNQRCCSVWPSANEKLPAPSW